MLRIFVDLFAACIQSYMSAILICRIFDVKEPYKKSLLVVFLQNLTSYVVVNYFFNETIAQKIVAGDIVFIIFGCYLFKGSKIRRILKSMLEHGAYVLMDFILELLMFPFFMNVLLSLPFSQRQLLGRNIATSIILILYAIFELCSNRKEGRKTKGIAWAAVCLGFVQLFILDALSKSNPEALVESRLIITALCSITVIGGYLVIDELFKQKLEQQRKQAELEQIALEKRYQYDYYQKALAQGERIRDIRHDMRNQLQTVEYLLCSESEENRRRAEEMVEMLSEKAGGVC